MNDSGADPRLFETDADITVPAIEQVRLTSKRARPVDPSSKGRPTRQEGPERADRIAPLPQRHDDPEMWSVHDAIIALDPAGARFGYAIRQAFDQAYDGQRTGRWDYTQLMKTEKTHIGTLVEIWLQREFGFQDGVDLDYSIAGVDVDAKWSRNLNGWEIPLEMYSRGEKLAMLLWANEDTVRMAVGLLRISDQMLLPPGRQRDGKRRLSGIGISSILWTHVCDLAFPNTLLNLGPEPALSIARSRSGQAAVNRLFREAQGQVIDRTAVTTAAQQVDSAKRVRDARQRLAKEGIVIFGHYQPHPDLAARLGLPAPTLGRFVSARLAPWNDGDHEPYIELASGTWRIARPEEPLSEAPKLPRQGSEPGLPIAP